MLSDPRLFCLKRVVHATSEPEKMNRARLNENRIPKWGVPVLVDTDTGQTYGRGDVLPDGRQAAEVYAELEREEPEG